MPATLKTVCSQIAVAAMLAIAPIASTPPVYASDADTLPSRPLTPPYDADSLFHRAYTYEIGDGVPVDFERAAGFYATSALLGHPPSQLRLAAFLIGGIGVDRDQAAAAEWLLIAISGQDAAAAADARAMLDGLLPSLAAADLEQAEARAQAFAPSQDPLAAAPRQPASVQRAITIANLGPRPTRAELEERLGVRFCGVPTIDQANDGGFVVRGYREAGEVSNFGDADRDWLKQRRIAAVLAQLSSPVCAYVAFIGGLPAPARSLKAEVTDALGVPVGPVSAGTEIMLTLPAQDFAGIVSVDYVSHTGEVYHLASPVQNHRAVLRRDASLTLGGPGDGRKRWMVGPEPGRDMVIVTVSEVPMYDQSRPSPENALSYLEFLQQRLSEPGVETRIYHEILHTVPPQ